MAIYLISGNGLNLVFNAKPYASKDKDAAAIVEAKKLSKDFRNVRVIKMVIHQDTIVYADTIYTSETRAQRKKAAIQRNLARIEKIHHN